MNLLRNLFGRQKVMRLETWHPVWSDDVYHEPPPDEPVWSDDVDDDDDDSLLDEEDEGR
ncbi:hypothetical protein IQ268_09075 [Oculatella sp. LEGE 06141]|uniref:hypothetical protein n=1 Tax=Oculatella sp. LEGE 06141 TaxID=1828648 RepID=UPI0018829BC2|nr:hypothetical protein [Oculatella sp. LEGE 06141]MBE9178711.1 hypothetical protein [Oculatella sp. LEGE 06141]